MKKAIVILMLFLVSIVTVSANNAETSAGTGIKNGNVATTLVSLDLSDDANMYAEVWFAESYTDGQRMPDGGKTTVKLSPASNSNEFTNANDDLYVCWNILWDAPIDVKLYMSQALWDADATAHIDWTVKNKEDGETTVDIANNGTMETVILPYNATGVAADAIQLEVATNGGENWANIPAGKTYSAYLTVEAKTE